MKRAPTKSKMKQLGALKAFAAENSWPRKAPSLFTLLFFFPVECESPFHAIPCLFHVFCVIRCLWKVNTNSLFHFNLSTLYIKYEYIGI